MDLILQRVFYRMLLFGVHFLCDGNYTANGWTIKTKEYG